MNAIKKAIDLLGTPAIARLYKPALSPQAVHKWIATRVPSDRCPAIERATGGAVRCEDLRPDVDWAYLRGTNKEAA